MRYYLVFATLLGLVACYEEPEFPVEPSIEFADIRFVESKDPSNPYDTLKITVSFRDGDGDLGIVDPGQPFLDSLFNGEYIRYGQYDTLPEHNCTNYRSGYFNQNGVFVQSTRRVEITDTIYVRPNPYYYNFFVDLFLVKNGREEALDLIEINYPLCGNTLNGRFRLNTDGRDKPLSGAITYNIANQSLLPFFSDDSIRVRVRIADQAAHLSNRVESPVFTLRGIQTNP
jgi:hypothetical protein